MLHAVYCLRSESFPMQQIDGIRYISFQMQYPHTNRSNSIFCLYVRPVLFTMQVRVSAPYGAATSYPLIPIHLSDSEKYTHVHVLGTQSSSFILLSQNMWVIPIDIRTFVPKSSMATATNGCQPAQTIMVGRKRSQRPSTRNGPVRGTWPVRVYIPHLSPRLS